MKERGMPSFPRWSRVLFIFLLGLEMLIAPFLIFNAPDPATIAVGCVYALWFIVTTARTTR